MAGVGLLGTSLSLKLTIGGAPAQVVGYVMALYYFGMFMGSFYCHRLIKSVGHIRSFAAFAAVTTAIAMLHGLYMSPMFWGVLRFFTGVCLIGLFMTIESWLNECAGSQFRGRAMSIYMVMNYLGMGAGQQLLNLGGVQETRSFLIVGLILALCLVPVVVTHSIHPKIPAFERFSILVLFRKAPIGMLGCLTSGLINGAFYSIMPVFCHQIGLTVSELSRVMTATIIGGLLLQWPVGNFSDRFDRTIVLAFIGLAITVLSVAIMLVAETLIFGLLVSMVMFGGLIFTIYPLSVARAHDLFDIKDIVPVSSVLLLFFGTGAMVGPILASAFMTVMKTPYGFFAYFAFVASLYSMTTFYLRKKEFVKIIPVDKNVPFVAMKETWPVVALIDSSGDVEVELDVNKRS
jgi:MFS family permease